MNIDMESLGKELFIEDPFPSCEALNAPTGEVSFLIGAGFSVNQGYPTANQLNDKLASIDPDKFSIDGEGNLHFIQNPEDDNNWYDSRNRTKSFIRCSNDFYVKTTMLFVIAYRNYIEYSKHQ